jgi:hypothetical protein
MRIGIFIVALALSGPLALGAEIWPKRFIWAQGKEHTLVLLYEDGRAAFSSRHMRPDKSEYYFVASRANWVYCEGTRPDRLPQCISVHIQGFSSLRDGEFRFDYELQNDTLTEIDEDGPGMVLKRYCDKGEAGCTSNTSLERTREG